MSDGADRFDRLRELDEKSKSESADADASEAASDAPADVSDGADAAPDPAPDPASEDTSRAGARDDADTSTPSESTASPADAPDGPAFDFDETKQRPLYARERAWDAFEDTLALDVERILRERGVRDAEKREYHDAALRVVAEHGEEIAERMLRERGIDPE